MLKLARSEHRPWLTANANTMREPIPAINSAAASQPTRAAAPPPLQSCGDGGCCDRLAVVALRARAQLHRAIQQPGRRASRRATIPVVRRHQVGNRDLSAVVPLVAARRSASSRSSRLGSTRLPSVVGIPQSEGRTASADVSSDHDRRFRAEEKLATDHFRPELALVAKRQSTVGRTQTSLWSRPRSGLPSFPGAHGPIPKHELSGTPILFVWGTIRA